MTSDAADEIPSKSARKRAALAAQALGERLVSIREPELAALPLPENVKDAIREARDMRSRTALVRQRQYIGKLMRDVDPAPIEAALEGSHRTNAADAERDKRADRWRRRLLDEGDAALDALAQTHPRLDRPKLAQLLRAATTLATTEALRTTAARQLFRELRALLSR